MMSYVEGKTKTLLIEVPNIQYYTLQQKTKMCWCSI